MRSFDLDIEGERVTVQQDDDGAFIIPDRFRGQGTALKPAAEMWILARKPLGSTIAECVLKYGTGAINIDGCRLSPMASNDPSRRGLGYGFTKEGATTESVFNDKPRTEYDDTTGRWPANVILSHADECELIVDDDGTETVESWSCVPDCPVRLLDEQSGDRPSTPYRENEATGAVLPFIHRSAGGHSDKGGASRFYFTSKASRAEKDAGLDDFEPATAGAATGRKEGTDGLNSPRAGAGRTGGAKNTHPTPKRVDLMRYLTRLITPPKGLVIDPFCGSGSGGVAAMLEGMRFVGLELEPLHVDFARARIAHVVGGTWEREVKQERPVVKAQPGLFDLIGAGK